ncbi:MAG: FGGY family carbohydrate kinase [Lachnospiraceae bacterium]|jgi:xylulokinase|nr:FGGY family carbohydrate kinase [Lachnospiraceae bacterium]
MALAESYVLGMDCGTTNIKAVILGSDGSVAAEAARPNRFYSPGPGMQEQDAEEWWQSAKEIFRSLTAAAGSRATARIRGICISSHTVSLLPLDREGRPLRRAITYQDSRSGAELRSIVESIGRERYISIAAGQPSVAFLPGKLLWYKTHEPELFDKTACFLQASSFIVYRLTGEAVSDIDQALRTQCMDSGTLEWSAEIGKAIGTDLDRVLPAPRLINEIVGSVTPAASEETGLPAGIPVLAGCSDAMASMYATGMSRIGEAGESSGTTSLVFVGSRVKSAPDLPVVTRPCAIEGMPWIFDAPIQASGASLSWYISKLALREQEEAAARGVNIYDYLNGQALQAAPGSGGLFFFPYLLGERAPIWNDYARGMLIGLRMESTRAELTRSVFEGTAYALRHVMETVREAGAQADLLRICGGGAKSRTWCRIKASMLHMPVYLLDGNSGDVPVGDALIAGDAVGVFQSLTEAVREVIKVREIIEPDPSWERAYDELYPYYVRMYRDLDADLLQLHGTLAGLQSPSK